MKLSEAMRLGAMTKPQNFGRFYAAALRIERTAGFPWFRIYEVETACAMGAAYDAVGRPTSEIKYRRGDEIGVFRGKSRIAKRDETSKVFECPLEWQPVFWAHVACPQCSQFEGQLNTVVPHLNDKHRWSRERIADFVEQIENEQEAKRLEIDALPLAEQVAP